MNSAKLEKLIGLLSDSNLPFIVKSFIDGKRQVILMDGPRYHVIATEVNDDTIEIMNGLTKSEARSSGTIELHTADEVFERMKYCYKHKTDYYKPKRGKSDVKNS